MMKDFEKWILQNYKPCEEMECFPEDWDREKEFFYKIDGLQYRIQFSDGPLIFLRAIGNLV